MSRWTDEELRELVTLWPTNSASEIAKRLHRLRSAVRGKAVRLRFFGTIRLARSRIETSGRSRHLSRLKQATSVGGPGYCTGLGRLLLCTA